jgi:hypothetical protein
MRRHKIALLMMSFAMGTTVMVGCGETARLRALNSLYNIVMGLAYEVLLARLTA